MLCDRAAFTGAARSEVLICVAGACSRSGKTALAETIVKSLADEAPVAVKFTTTDDVFERCPRGMPCVVCDIDVPFRIVGDAATLEEPGTDTERLLRAGAARVIWVIAKRHAVGAAWAAIGRDLTGAAPIVMEGSTIVGETRPDYVFFVVHPQLSTDRWKPSASQLIERADLVVVNRPAGEKRAPSAQVLQRIERSRRGPMVIADAQRPMAEWAPEMADAVRRGSPMPAAG